jgi:hypothetical protein
MGFLRRLFGGDKKENGYRDEHGIYVYVKNERCDAYVRTRIDKRHDLNREGNGYIWHKTIVDAKCFQRLQAVIHFDNNYNVTSQQIDPPGKFITEEEYEAGLAAQEAARRKAEAEAAEEEEQKDRPAQAGGGSSGFE